MPNKTVFDLRKCIINSQDDIEVSNRNLNERIDEMRSFINRKVAAAFDPPEQIASLAV